MYESWQEDPCPTNGGREKNDNWCCPGGIPIKDDKTSTGWSCWWCGGKCDPLTPEERISELEEKVTWLTRKMFDLTTT